jgi:Lon protease-like protein
MIEPPASIGDLPAHLRIFPLAGAILPPRAVLPLNIFEPRYLAMVRDAIAGDGLIGMVQPRTDEPADRPPLYRTGGVGRITRFSETGDGRLLIALTGIMRFSIRRELAVATPYRQVEADYQPFAHDWEPAAGVPATTRAELEAQLKSFLEAHDLSADWDAVHGAEDESLVNTLAMASPFSTSERQALLEAPTPADRAATLVALMTLAVPGGSDSLQ